MLPLECALTEPAVIQTPPAGLEAQHLELVAFPGDEDIKRAVRGVKSELSGDYLSEALDTGTHVMGIAGDDDLVWADERVHSSATTFSTAAISVDSDPGGIETDASPSSTQMASCTE